MTMNTNARGIALIKQFEGFRSNAYRCPAGIWTVGYGHTSAAGAPQVGPLTKVTRQEAEEILINDLDKFEVGVDRAVKVPLTPNQFSALVSFAYNVGVGAFRSSSVLKAVNAGDFDAVPRRLALWVKGGGKTLPGLVKRRAAEADLFMEPDKGLVAEETRITPDVPKGKSAAQSTTNIAASAAGVAGTVAVISDVSTGAATAAGSARTIYDTLGDFAPWIALAVLLGAVGWIIRERLKKSREEAL